LVLIGISTKLIPKSSFIDVKNCKNYMLRSHQGPVADSDSRVGECVHNGENYPPHYKEF
jgi:hypothetical protein